SANWAFGARDLSANPGRGGGASQCVLNYCTLTGNSALGDGGGASGSRLHNCVLTSNSADVGGGAYGGTLNNCTLTGNSASTYGGGGAYGCTLNNCIVYFNTRWQSPNYDNYDSSSTLNYSCTMPLPAGGVGNISSNPQLASAS